MNSGLLVLLVAVAGATAWGLWRAVTNGRFLGTHSVRVAGAGSAEPAVQAPDRYDPQREVSLLDGTPWAATLGERATLLQFSSAFCAPCRATRQLLSDVARTTPGVVHLEVDAEHNLSLVRRLGILRTPTTVVLDRGGREVVRATGAPRRDQVHAALESVGGPHDG